jgi:hypothetical protein
MKTEPGMDRQGQRREQAPQAQNEQKVDGVDQVFQMLRIADPAFRESLLQRLSARDTELARTLREKLAQAGIRA